MSQGPSAELLWHCASLGGEEEELGRGGARGGARLYGLNRGRGYALKRCTGGRNRGGLAGGSSESELDDTQTRSALQSNDQPRAPAKRSAVPTTGRAFTGGSAGGARADEARRRADGARRSDEGKRGEHTNQARALTVARTGGAGKRARWSSAVEFSPYNIARGEPSRGRALAPGERVLAPAGRAQAPGGRARTPAGRTRARRAPGGGPARARRTRWGRARASSWLAETERRRSSRGRRAWGRKFGGPRRRAMRGARRQVRLRVNQTGCMGSAWDAALPTPRSSCSEFLNDKTDEQRLGASRRAPTSRSA